MSTNCQYRSAIHHPASSLGAPSRKKVELILFDLGGVLVELGPSPLKPEWLTRPISFGAAEWHTHPVAQGFERGLVTPEPFARAMIEALALDASVEAVLDQFTAWPKGVYPGGYELLGKLGEAYRLAVLSNSNCLHWPRVCEEFALPPYFEAMYSSHQIHQVKPDPAAFMHVLAALDIAADKVLFLDDNQSNVDTASQLGMQAQRVLGIDQVQQAVANHGLLAQI